MTLSPLSEIFVSATPLELEHGGVLDSWQLGYELVGPASGPVVLVHGGISASRHVCATRDCAEPGWWDDVVGPHKAIDTDHYRVLGIDYLGGPGASTSAGVGGLPVISSKDQAEATAALLDELDIDLHACVGSSYGGMVCLALAVRVPERIRHLVMIGAADKSHPTGIAWRSLQRRVLALGRENESQDAALSIARGMGMLSYRSPDEFLARFSSVPEWNGGLPKFPVESYLEARGQSFIGRFTSEALECLSRAIDLHDVDVTGLCVPCTLVGISSDQIVPITQVEALAERIPSLLRYVRIESLYGHDGFLKEVEQVGRVVREALMEVPR